MIDDVVDFLDNKPIRNSLIKVWLLGHMFGAYIATKHLFPMAPKSAYALVIVTAVLIGVIELELLGRLVHRPLGVIDFSKGNKLFYLAFGSAFILAGALFAMELRDRASQARQQRNSDREARERVQWERSLTHSPLLPESGK